MVSNVKMKSYWSITSWSIGGLLSVSTLKPNMVYQKNEVYDGMMTAVNEEVLYTWKMLSVDLKYFHHEHVITHY